MFQEYKVLIASNEKKQHDMLINYLKNMKLCVYECNNEEDAIEIAAVKHLPDIIIFDGSLLTPAFLDDLALHLPKNMIPPVYINLYTYEDTDHIAAFEKCGVRFSNHIPYDPCTIAKYVKFVCSKFHVDIMGFAEYVHPAIAELVSKCKIPNYVTGYSYLVYAVEANLFNLNISFKTLLKYNIYPYINYKCGKNESEKTIEHSIRVAVASGWKKMNDEEKAALMGSSLAIDRRPSNRIMINKLSSIIKKEYSIYFSKITKEAYNKYVRQQNTMLLR